MVYFFVLDTIIIIVSISVKYVVGSISFRPDIQRPRQMQNALRDI